MQNRMSQKVSPYLVHEEQNIIRTSAVRYAAVRI